MSDRDTRPSANDRLKASYREILGASMVRSVLVHAAVLMIPLSAPLVFDVGPPVEVFVTSCFAIRPDATWSGAGEYYGRPPADGVAGPRCAPGESARELRADALPRLTSCLVPLEPIEPIALPGVRYELPPDPVAVVIEIAPPPPMPPDGLAAR